MDLVLRRKTKSGIGIFGELLTLDGKLIAHTLEHAYHLMTTTSVDQETKTVSATSSWEAKVPDGVFRCVRGMHQLHHGKPFETFMVTGVPNHSGILFHIGNYNRDSEGCILVGLTSIPDGIGNSGDAFKALMELQRGRADFFLTVEG
jgi:hypothetical protein